eukprot:g2190.t1
MKTFVISFSVLLVLCTYTTTLDGVKLPRRINRRRLTQNNYATSGSTKGSSSHSSASVTSTSSGVHKTTSSAYQYSSSSYSSSSSSSSYSKAKVVTSTSAHVHVKKSPTKVRKSPTPVVHQEELNLTERVRDAILDADIPRLTQLLVENNEITELALGFTFPPELRDEYLFESENRFTDPDVISLKGMANATLVASGQASKLTEIFIDAIYGLDFDSNLCPEPSPSPIARDHDCDKSSPSPSSVSKQVTASATAVAVGSRTESYTRVVSSDLNSTATISSASTSTNCGGSAKASPEPIEAVQESRIPECYTPEEIISIRSGLLEDFKDQDLMNRILFGDPTIDFRRRFRKLLVIGTPVDSWPCASCWEPEFCNANVWWCPQ